MVPFCLWCKTSSAIALLSLLSIQRNASVIVCLLGSSMVQLLVPFSFSLAINKVHLKIQ